MAVLLAAMALLGACRWSQRLRATNRHDLARAHALLLDADRVGHHVSLLGPAVLVAVSGLGAALVLLHAVIRSVASPA